MNCYADLSQIKDELGIDGNDDNTRLLAILNAASRYIDNFCQRHFYTKNEKRYFDGDGDKLLVSDLLSVTTLKLDNDQDMTYEDSLVSTDYEMYPLNEFPKWLVEISEDSDYSDFAKGVVKGVEIDGVWGYGNGISATPYATSGETVTASDDSTTSVTASDGSKFEMGQTILVESEQIYIESISSDTLTVKRGINGTSGAEHSSQTAYIYEYPDGIVQACLMIASRLFESRGKVFDSERLGDYSYSRGKANAAVMEAEKALLMGYRRMEIC